MKTVCAVIMEEAIALEKSCATDFADGQFYNSKRFQGSVRILRQISA